MFGSEILEVALGLTFIYLVFSLLLTSIQELIETRLKTRAKTLEEGIRQLLADPGGKDLATAFYSDPLIDALYSGAYAGAGTKTRNLPSYIPAQTFSAVLLSLHNAGELAKDCRVGQVLDRINNLTGGDLAKTRKELEDWFDGAMERVSGTYKRKTQVRVLIVATILTVCINVNTLAIVQSLMADNALRAAVAAQAEATAKATPPVAQSQQAVKARISEIKQLGVPLGWDRPQQEAFMETVSNSGGWFSALLGLSQILLGWGATIAAISLGAPFWFDALNKIMVVRATVKPFEKSKPEASEDRQK